MVKPLNSEKARPLVKKREAGQRVGTTSRPWDPSSLADPHAEAIGINEDVRAFLAKHSLTAAKRLVAIIENERTGNRDATAACKIVLDYSGIKPDANQAGLGAAAGALAKVADALRPDEQRIRRQAALDEYDDTLVS